MLWRIKHLKKEMIVSNLILRKHLNVMGTITLKFEMNKLNKKYLLLLILACLIGFSIPFFTKTKDESLNSTISTSLMIVSTLVTIITLFVAILLFDRFGVNAKLKEKQLNTVLELINEFKLLRLTVSNEQWMYINYIKKCTNLEMLPKDIYNDDKSKALLIPYNFHNLLKPIYILLTSVWLPSDIKEKMNFLNFFAVKSIDDFDFSKYVKLDINNMGIEPWVITAPRFTFEMFSINLSILLNSTLQWIKQHSDINVDFDLIDENINTQKKYL